MAKRRKYKAEFSIGFKIDIPKDLVPRWERMKAMHLSSLNGTDLDIDRPLLVDLIGAVEGMAQVVARVRACGTKKK